MSDRISLARWFEPTVALVAASGVAISARVIFGNSRVIAGGMVFIAAALIVVTVVLWGRVERTEPRHSVAYGLLPLLLVAALLAVDLEYVLEHGMVVNTAGHISLIVGGFFARSRVQAPSWKNMRQEVSRRSTTKREKVSG